MYYYESQKRYVLKNREKINARNREKRRIKRLNNPNKRKVYSEYSGMSSRDRLRAVRMTVLRHYGGNPPKCACCTEDQIKFLSIDHINGGGNQHRRSIASANGKGGNMSFWLIKNGLPEGFQILCHNCNMAKGFYGACPHKEEVYL